MSFKTNVLIIIAGACLVCAGISVLISGIKLRSLGEEGLISEARAILSRLEAVRGYVATQGGLTAVIERVTQRYPDGQLPEDAKAEVLKQVPIFASMKVGLHEAEKEGYSFRVFAADPRNKKNAPTETEMEILKRFEADSALPEIIQTNEHNVTVYRPVRLSESQGCLKCHGDPATSPWKNGKDILGYPMENWKDNRLHGVFAVVSKLDDVHKATTRANFTIWFASIGLSLIATLIGILFLNKPLSAVSAIANKLRESGEQLHQASEEIASASHSQSAAASQAAASLEVTTSSTEEMSSMIQLNAKNAAEAQNLSSQCEVKAKQGQAEVEKLRQAMAEISSSSKKMKDIISAIDEIAFQTNLLALNAAVEAARAGEQGKGFAVVAEAVRALAHRSSSSAKEISDLIQSSVDKIQMGSDTAEKSGKSLGEIVASVEKVAHLNTEIANASHEQAQGVQNINKAIHELDKVTQQTAASSEQTSASSDQLKVQSEQLHGYVIELFEVLDKKKAS